MLVAHLCGPRQSWMNTAESHVCAKHYITKLWLSSNCSPEIEKILKNCTNMHGVQKKSTTNPNLQNEWTLSKLWEKQYVSSLDRYRRQSMWIQCTNKIQTLLLEMFPGIKTEQTHARTWVKRSNASYPGNPIISDSSAVFCQFNA